MEGVAPCSKVLIVYTVTRQTRSNTMNSFIRRHAVSVIGVLSGFDRLFFRGTLRRVANVKGMMGYLWGVQVPLKDFARHVCETSDRVKQASLRLAERLGRPVQYLSRPGVSKEDVARQIAERDGIKDGLIAVLTSVELCQSYEVYRNRQTRHIELQSRTRKCLHLYHYFQHRQFGFMHVRLQTWFPFNMWVCMNGREWLACQMKQAGIGFLRRDNCFINVADVGRAQRLLDRQLKTDWPKALNRVAEQIHPLRSELFRAWPSDYYWSADQTEWATDVMFRSARALEGLYPQLVQHGMSALGSREVLRFLGRKVPVSGGVHGCFEGEVLSDLRQRPEGIRIKHRVNRNSVKMYDKQGSVLRVETTINDARDLKVYRSKEGDSGGQRSWRRLRKGVADMERRAEISQAANDRYLEAMAAVSDRTTLGELIDPLCRPVTWKGKRVRALNPFAPEDRSLLKAVGRGEFLLNGVRNRDLQRLLYAPTRDPRKVRRRSGAVTRKLRLLRAHGLVHKVPHTHRYQLSPKGRLAIAALLAAGQADPDQLTKVA
jgi:hypothetical protein